MSRSRQLEQARIADERRALNTPPKLATGEEKSGIQQKLENFKRGMLAPRADSAAQLSTEQCRADHIVRALADLKARRELPDTPTDEAVGGVG